MSKEIQKTYSFKVSLPEFVGLRVDKFLLIELEKINILTSRSKIQKLIENNLLTKSDKIITDNSYITKLGDDLKIILEDNIDEKDRKLTATEIDFEIVFEDEHLAIINKPAGLTTHPGAGNFDNTLANGLLYKFQNSLSNENGNHRPGIVHRLDKDTSGLMVIAKDNQSHMLLSKAIQDKEVTRKYLTYIFGVINPASGKIEKAISRHKYNRLKMSTSKSNSKSRDATTLYKTIKIFQNGFASLVECQLLTGRTHQIRVHLESIKHSVIGDQVYNSCKKGAGEGINPENFAFVSNFPRQALHSYHIEFIHPITKEPLKFIKEPPQDMQDLHNHLLPVK